MLRKSSSKKSKRHWFFEYLKSVMQSIKFFLLAILFVIFIVPVLYIYSLNFINPPVTPLMLQRSIEGHDKHFVWVDTPKNMRHAVIASEDNKFCSHSGFDWQALRTVIGNTIKGGRTAGASTISMQTSKNLLLLPTRSFIRKILEGYYTVWLELLIDKKRIIQLYLNIIEYAPGVYGVEAASQHYFSKPAKKLTRQQAAQLASVLPNPLHWSIRGQRRKAKIIQRRVRSLGSLLSCVK